MSSCRSCFVEIQSLAFVVAWTPLHGKSPLVFFSGACVDIPSCINTYEQWVSSKRFAYDLVWFHKCWQQQPCTYESQKRPRHNRNVSEQLCITPSPPPPSSSLPLRLEWLHHAGPNCNRTPPPTWFQHGWPACNHIAQRDNAYFLARWPTAKQENKH